VALNEAAGTAALPLGVTSGVIREIVTRVYVTIDEILEIGE
jgi:hypothetical protein